MKKFKLTDETIEIYGRTLHRIECIEDIPGVKVGDKGGFIENGDNLSDNAWVSDNAVVFGNARVFNNARVSDNAHVYGNAMVYGDAAVFGNARVSDNAMVSDDATVLDNAMVYGYAMVFGNARVSDNAMVYGDAMVFGNAQISNDAKVYHKAADYIVFKNWWSSGRYFTWTRSNNMWRVGCFYGTGAELIAKAYKDSERSGIEYERVVKYVETISSDINNI